MGQFEIKKFTAQMMMIAAVVMLYALPVLPNPFPVIVNQVVPLYIIFGFFDWRCLDVDQHSDDGNDPDGNGRPISGARVMGFCATISRVISPLGFLVYGILSRSVAGFFFTDWKWSSDAGCPPMLSIGESMKKILLPVRDAEESSIGLQKGSIFLWSKLDEHLTYLFLENRLTYSSSMI